MTQLFTLGGLALVDGAESPLVGRRKLLAFLTYLARLGGRPIGREQLIDLFWSDVDESRGRRSLRTAIAELRAAVPALVVGDDDDVRLTTGAIELDAALFEADVAEGRFEAAEQRWQGEFLDGLEDVGGEAWRFWLETERARLRNQLAFALESLCAAAESAGRAEDVVYFADRWASIFPGDERAAIRLIVALRAAGRDSESVARHGQLSRALAEATGADPSPAFVKLLEGWRPEVHSPGIRGLFSPDLVGRGSALGTLAGAWREVQAGAGRCVLVDGVEGSGKTRLLEEYARQVKSEAGARVVVVARAFASEQQRRHSALRAVLDLLANADGLAAAPASVLATLGSAAPAVRERFRSATGAPLEMAEAVSRALSDIGYEQPVVVIVDDASVADEDSLSVFASLVRRPPDRVLVILAGASDTWDAVPAVDELRRLPHASWLTLAPLTADETRAFVQSVANVEPTVLHHLAERLHAESGGRPGVLLSLLRLLAEHRSLVPGPSGTWRLTSDPATLVLPIPGEVGAEMQASLASLRPESRRVLDAAAVLGQRADASLLEGVAGLDPNAYRAAVADLLVRRLLRVPGSADGSFEFRGESERRVVYAAIVPSTRRSLHAIAAKVLGSATDEPSRARAIEHRRLGGFGAKRRVAVMTAVAAGVVALAAASFFVTRDGLVTPGAPILLASVENRTTDSTLGTALDVPVRIALQQSTRFTLLPARQVSDVLSRMRKTMPATGLDERLAQEIAIRENLPAFIHLSISAIDSTYLITGRIIEPDHGRDLYSATSTANGRASILTAMDEVLKRIRTSLGESRLAVRGIEQSLPRITTSSLDALRFYSAGRQEWLKLNFAGAKLNWMRAVELDTAFALALAALSDFYYAVGDGSIDRTAGSAYHNRALAHADRLSERERLVLAAAVSSRRGTPEEAQEKYRTIAERYPDRDTWYSYGTSLMRADKFNEAIPVLRRSVVADSMFAFGWVNLATSYKGANKIDSALFAYGQAAKYGDFLSIGGNVNQEWGSMYLQVGQRAKAESIFTAAVTRGQPLDRSLAMRSLAWLGMYEGKYRSAAARLENASTMAEGVGSGLSGARNRWLQAMAELELGEAALARRHLDRAESNLGSVNTDPIFLFYLAELRLRSGDVSGTRRLQQRLEKAARRENPTDRSTVSLLRAEFALLEGNLDSATAEARKVENRGLEGFRDRVLSEAYERLGRADSALAAAQRLEAKFQFGWEVQYYWTHAPLRVARLALRMGDTTLAREQLERQLDRWKDADAEFADLVAALQLLARLRSR